MLDGLERLGTPIPGAVREAADVTRFAWEARYPGVAELGTEEEYREAATQATRVVRWAEGLIEVGSR